MQIVAFIVMKVQSFVSKLSFDPLTLQSYLLLDWMIIIKPSVIMIEANKIIFPSPKQDQNKQKYLKQLQPNIIYIPKQEQVTIGCLCHSFIAPKMTLPSTISTARTYKSDANNRTIKIRSSKQLQLKVMKARHQRSDTKVLSILTGRNSNLDENTQININTIRNAFPEKFQHPAISQNIKAHLTRNRSKFLSDDLYQQDDKEEFENGGQIQTVRMFNKNHNKFSLDSSRTSQLWNYQKKQERGLAIPCLYFQSSHYADKIMLYFHGNGQDLTGCHSFLKHLCSYTQISVLAVEYPGYSIYEGSPSSDAIESDGREVIEFLRHRIGFQMHNIMVIGRSIGSGPALHVSSLYQIGGLVLLSPFLSLCEVVSDLYGTIASSLLKQRFDNKKRATDVQSPCLIVHGTKDKLISQKHATELSQYFRGYCMTKIVKQMSHSIFSHEEFFSLVNDFQAAIQFVQ